MRCAWDELLSILPPKIRLEVDRQGRADLQEIRLRHGKPAELVMSGGRRWLSIPMGKEDLHHCINFASRYSPWSAASAAKGFLTAPGGHRIGICGDAVVKDGIMTGFREITSLCIRIARDVPGIAAKAANLPGSIIILGAPGWGKTTLLRDLIRQFSDKGQHIGVVDERGEIFPGGIHFPAGACTDILSACSKSTGIETLLRTMSPECIAVDEITAEKDCKAMLQAAFCGVRLLATAHAGSLSDFRHRKINQPLLEAGIFTTALVLNREKFYKLERMDL